MCSFDVSSLFTNVPLDETIQICLDKLYALSDPPTMPRSVLKVLLEFTAKKSSFIFNGQYYDQIGPILANIFICHFQEKWVLSNNAPPSVWFRYVDDTFTLFDNKNTATQFLHYLNKCHANIKENHGEQFDTSWPSRMRIVLLCGLTLCFSAYEITKNTVKTGITVVKPLLS